MLRGHWIIVDLSNTQNSSMSSSWAKTSKQSPYHDGLKNYTNKKKTTLTKHLGTYIHCQWKIEIFLINLYYNKISVKIHQKPGGITKKVYYSQNVKRWNKLSRPFFWKTVEKKSQWKYSCRNKENLDLYIHWPTRQLRTYTNYLA